MGKEYVCLCALDNTHTIHDDAAADNVGEAKYGTDVSVLYADATSHLLTMRCGTCTGVGQVCSGSQ